jgi:hypothetical protein
MPVLREVEKICRRELTLSARLGRQDKANSRSPLPAVETAVCTMACSAGDVASHHLQRHRRPVFSFSVNGCTASCR